MSAQVQQASKPHNTNLAEMKGTQMRLQNMGPMRSMIAMTAIAATAASCSSDGGSADTGPQEWDLSMYVGVNDPVTERARNFAEQVSAATDGALEITVRPAGELPFAPDEILRRVGDNSVTMGDANGSFVSGDCQIATAGFLPLLIRNIEEWESAWEELEAPTQECFESFDAHAVVSYSYPSQNIWGKGDTPESCLDLGGLTVRQTGPASGEFLSRIGADPVTLSTSEVPDALGRGVVDAAVTSATTVIGNGWDVDYGCILDFAAAPSFVLVNDEELNSLPADIREDFLHAADEFEQALLTDLADIDEESVETMRENDIDVVEVPPAELEQLASSMEEYWDQWAQEVGPEASESLEAVRAKLGR